MTSDSHNSTAPAPASPQAIRRQVVLPLSKAVEIAYKSIRMRLSRSLLVTSGIVLALAFLMSILTNDAMVGGMRAWITAFPDSPRMQQVVRERHAVVEQSRPLEQRLHAAAVAHDSTEGKPPFNARATFGMELPDLQAQLHGLPAGADDLAAALTAHPDLLPVMQQWVDLSRKADRLREEQNGPQWLQKLMKDNGVAITPAEIVANRIQTRWLLGLALLVAFVGILNAMLMSVTERFREIGTMKCLGALDGFIIKLFLIESLFQGLVGTTIGIVTGLGLSLAALAGAYGHYAWQNVPMGAILISAAICLGVGVALTVAGAVYPAWQAARMQPIEAMRVET